MPENNLFKEYASFYDEYYINKDYQEETNHVLKLAERLSPNINSILDVGCGTGGHAIPLVKLGKTVKGIDISKEMIEFAKSKAEKLKLDNLSFENCNILQFQDNNRYDLVISMFAVMGYLTTNDDFINALKVISKHLRDNGLFIFDVWFGPAVINQKPEVRIQEFTLNNKKVLRMVKPVLDIINQIVIVNYDIIKFDGKIVNEEVQESHKMRYFFIQELKYFLNQAGLELVNVMPFMKIDQEPSLTDWNISIISQKKG